MHSFPHVNPFSDYNPARKESTWKSGEPDEVYAFKGMGHENVRPVYAAAQPQQATEGSRLSDLRGLLADAQPKQPNGQA